MINKKITYFTISLWTFGLLYFQLIDKMKNENSLLNFQLFNLGLLTQWGMIQFGLSCCAYFEKGQSEYSKDKNNDEDTENVVIKISSASKIL